MMIISYGVNDEPCPYCGSTEAHHECEYLTPPQEYLGVPIDVPICECCEGSGYNEDGSPCFECGSSGRKYWIL